jgi:hypothetical protein
MVVFSQPSRLGQLRLIEGLGLLPQLITELVIRPERVLLRLVPERRYFGQAMNGLVLPAAVQVLFALVRYRRFSRRLKWHDSGFLSTARTLTILRDQFSPHGPFLTKFRRITFNQASRSACKQPGR